MLHVAPPVSFGSSLIKSYVILDRAWENKQSQVVYDLRQLKSGSRGPWISPWNPFYEATWRLECTKWWHQNFFFVGWHHEGKIQKLVKMVNFGIFLLRIEGLNGGKTSTALLESQDQIWDEKDYFWSKSGIKYKLTLYGSKWSEKQDQKAWSEMGSNFSVKWYWNGSK